MYRCDTNRSNDYGTCYVQYYESQNRTVLACALEDAAKYNGMTGSKSCSIDNSGKGIYDAQVVAICSMKMGINHQHHINIMNR